MSAPLVERRVRKTVPCRRCSRPLTRTTVLREYQHAVGGRVKSIEQICAELRARAEAWQPANDLCGPCEAFPDAAFIPYDPTQKARTH